MKKLTFQPLIIQKPAEYIEKKIKDAILKGGGKKGDRLPTEKELAAQFGVSLVTLRQALRGLEIIGLIQKRKGLKGGVFVSEINDKSIKASLEDLLNLRNLSPQHLYQVRKIIEPPCVRLACQEITPDEIKKIEDNVSYCEGKLSKIRSTISEKDFFDLDLKNNDYHRLIANGTHNPILGLTIDYVFDFLWECETSVLIPDARYTKENIEDHRDILEYLKKKDGAKCEERMMRHLDRLDKYLQIKQNILKNKKLLRQ